MERRSQAGFTLPELLVAGALFGVLAVVAVIFIRPVDYESVRRNAERQAGAAQIAQVLKAYAEDNGRLPEGVTSDIALIGRHQNMLDLCPALTPKHAKTLPVDPEAYIEGASCANTAEPFITGFAVQTTGDKEFMVSAPLAEGDTDIAVSIKY